MAPAAFAAPADGDPTATAAAEAECASTAEENDFIKAVCGPDGTWGVEEPGGDPEFVGDDSDGSDPTPSPDEPSPTSATMSNAVFRTSTASGATMQAAAANDTSNGSIRHELTNNFIENTYATVSWVYFSGKNKYTGSYSVDLRTNLDGRTGVYSLYLKHISGQDIVVGNIGIGCREDGFFPLVCGNLYHADHTLGSPLSWENRRGNRLNNGDKYHTALQSHVEVFGDTLPVGTLSSSQFTCPDVSGNSVKDRCYFKK